MKGFFVRSAIIGSVSCLKVVIDIYDNNNNFVEWYIIPTNEAIGYCHCLEDFGYEDKGWVEEVEDEEIY